MTIFNHRALRHHRSSCNRKLPLGPPVRVVSPQRNLNSHWFLYCSIPPTSSDNYWHTIAAAEMNSARHRLIRGLNRLASTSATSAAPTAPSTAATSTSNPSNSTSNAVPRSSYATSTCPHMVDMAAAEAATINTRLQSHQQAPPTIKLEQARPYSEVPGPKPLPILGNTWR